LDLDSSVAKLSSGKRMQNAKHDAGGFQQAAKLGSRHKRDVASMQNLQNLVSYSQIQDGSLETVGKILNRMNTLATRALDVTATDNDRENYNKEFIELAAQLDEMKLEKFNGMDVFGAGGFSDEKQEFIDALKNGWLKNAEALVQSAYGLQANAADTWDLIVNEVDTGGYAAFVKASWDSTGTADVMEMQFDLPDFSAPHTVGPSEADRVVAHEMVHLIQAQNSFFGDIVDGNGRQGSWFKEGLAEMIHGGDDRVRGILGNTLPTDGDITNLLNEIGTGDESWTTNEQYGSAYLAARFLHYSIKTANKTMESTPGWQFAGTGMHGGFSGGQAGAKALTRWMADRFHNVSGATAANSGLDAGIAAFTNYANNDAFLAAFKGADGLSYVKDDLRSASSPALAGKFDYANNIGNADTGAIGNADAGGTFLAGFPVPGVAKDGQSVVDDVAGSPTNLTPTYETDKGSLAATIDGSGETWNLQSVNTITVSDTTTYNLESIANARGTLNQLTAWMTNLSSERSLVGANLSRLEKEMDSLSRKMGSREMAVSRIEDTDVARESTKFASNQVRMQASVAILAQAKQTNVLLADLVRGVNVGG
jgi:flagellin